MTISLAKGQNVSLSKTAPGLTAVTIGLGWDARVTDGADFDLDASLFMVTVADTVENDQMFVFYGNKTSPCQSVQHQGDNLTGDGDGDDEQIKINLTQVPDTVQKLIVAVTIHQAESRGQNFGQVSKAYMRVTNDLDSSEIARFDLSEDASIETAMLFGEIYRYNDEWKFRAIGQGHAGGLAEVCRLYGVSAA